MLNPLHKDIIAAANQMVCELEFLTNQSQKNKNKLTPHQKNLYFSGLRNLGWVFVSTKRLCKKPIPEKITAVLAISFALIKDKRYSDFTIVNQSVEAVKKTHGKKLGSLTNFILRNILNNKLNASNDEKNSIAKWNAPKWWIEKIKKDFGNDAEEILDINRLHPPMTLRVSDSSEKIEKIKNELTNDQTKIIKLGPNSLGIVPPYDIRLTRPFKNGQISFQDLSSQKVTEFIKPEKGMFILDACAAPGGKTFAIASRFSSVNIISTDISNKRLKLLKLDLIRQDKYLLSKPKLLVADLKIEQDKNKILSMSQNGFDFIILDVPCSGSGVTRRHPEIPWNRSIKQLKKLVELQSQLLQNAWDLLKIDGTLIYSVCSIFKDEGSDQISKFIKTNNNATEVQNTLIKPRVGDYPELTKIENSYLGFDGFFYALIKKNRIEQI